MEAAKKQAKNVKVLEFKGYFQKTIKRWLEKQKETIKCVAFERNFVTHETFLNFKEQFFQNQKMLGVNFNTLRVQKTTFEIERLKVATQITDLVFTLLLKKIRIGMTEKEVKGLIIALIYENGGDRLAFEPIVVSGVRCSLPHGEASTKKIVLGDLVTCDFGVSYKGYCSDLTRTFVVSGGEKETLLELIKIHKIVLDAQQTAIAKIRAGVRISLIDETARSVISSAGYGAYFSHSTGHGLGIDVHEMPVVNTRNIKNGETASDEILLEGMVITVEPGIYLPGIGGVRIEDDILVKEDGYEVLTKSSRSLFVKNEKT